MRVSARGLGIGVAAFFVGTLSAPSRALAEVDVLAALNALPGVTAVESTVEDDTKDGLRRFALQIEQPVDHFDSAAGMFRQKLVLFHRGYEAPMVLQTSGYRIFSERLGRLARHFGTNQLQVEHRFFGESVPAAPADWSKLTVRQSAEDFHRIALAFRTLYPRRWVNTGGSKGGMTSTYHRRFHPGDLDGTVADVAPLSFTTEDPRYIDFVRFVGGESYAGCRSSLESLQQTLLQRRDELLPKIEGEFSLLGGKGVSYEHSVIELPFIFWQYGDPQDEKLGCARVPASEAATDDLLSFLQAINDPASYDDQSLKKFQPYYYQAAVELGAPAVSLEHLLSQLLHPFRLEQYLPRGVPAAYSDATMHDVKDWIAREAKGFLFVYGELDPWTAGAYRDLNGAPGGDNHWYLVPGGNHGSNYQALPEQLRAEAVATLSRWFDKAPTKTSETRPGEEDLEDVEFRLRRSHR